MQLDTLNFEAAEGGTIEIIYIFFSYLQNLDRKQKKVRKHMSLAVRRKGVIY